MASDDWEIRTNIKSKPGSQGTLFQGGRKELNPQRRWPKGYTPERQADVHGGLAATTVHPTVKVNPPRRSDEVRARVVDAVSRSTVPVEHLDGLREIHDQPEKGTEATYWPMRKSLAVDMFHPDGHKNLIHELGHHRDNYTRESVGMTKANKDILYSPTGKGRAEAAEAVADNYYVEHHRDLGRNGRPPTQGRYEDTGNADHMPGYRAVRPAKPEHLSPQFEGLF